MTHPPARLPPGVSTTQAMYARYREGLSLARVAAEFCLTRQAAWERFRRAGLKMRPTYPRRTPVVVFNGKRYTERHDGYWRCTSPGRSQLHRDVWSHHHGPIPTDHDIHHRDGDRGNNDPANLQCITSSEHSRLHQHARQRPFDHKACLWCGGLMLPHRYGGHQEGPAAFNRRVFCRQACCHQWQKGRPKNASPRATA